MRVIHSPHYTSPASITHPGTIALSAALPPSRWCGLPVPDMTNEDVRILRRLADLRRKNPLGYEALRALLAVLQTPQVLRPTSPA